MKFFTFKGGVHPQENKEQTENMSTEDFLNVKTLKIALLQHIGTPLEPTVSVGERVLRGQKIADSDAFLSSPIHSPVSGKIKKIEILPFPLSGRVKTIVIANDGENEEVEYRKISNWKNLKKEELLSIIRNNGIVGFGGACFPTHIKLNPPKDKVIDTLILNGAECEPYLNSDNRLMIEKPEKIIEGIKIIMKILDVKKSYIGIENNKIQAIESMKKAINSSIKGDEKDQYDIEITSLQTKYPQGGEKQLIQAILGREVPSAGLPADIGVVVQNTGTAAAIYEGVVQGKPVMEKIVTVSGLATEKPMNLRVNIGTSFKEILDYAKVDREKMVKLVMGGPMMGMAQPNEDVGVVKGTSGLLALTKKEINDCKSRSCIMCGKCVTACPINLLPNMYAKLARFEHWEEMSKYHLMDCMECGTCAYICPSNRPLTEAIKIGKSKLRKIQI